MTIDAEHSAPRVSDVGLPTPWARHRKLDEQPTPMTINGAAHSRPPAPRPAASTSDAVSAYNAIMGAAKGFREHLDQVDAQRANLSPRGRTAAIAAFTNSRQAQAVDAAVASVRQARDDAAAAVADARKNLVTQGDAAAESRNSRYWNRTKSVLDSAADAGTLISAARQTIQNAGPAQISVLAEELPTLLQANNAPAEWLNGEFARATPQLHAAQMRLRQAERDRQVIEHDANVLRNGFREGCPPDSRTLVDPTAI